MTIEVLPVTDELVATAMRLVTRSLSEVSDPDEFEERWKYLHARLAQVAAGGPFSAMLLRESGRWVGISLFSPDGIGDREPGVACWELFWARGACAAGSRALARASIEEARERGATSLVSDVSARNRSARRGVVLAGLRPHEIEYRLSDIDKAIRRLGGARQPAEGASHG